MESLRGKLLIAGPALRDPNFHRTVVLVAEHGEEGAMGLVLNRPSELEVAEAVPGLDALVDADATISFGGPVGTTAVLVMVRFADPGQAGRIVLGDVGFLAEGAEVERVAEQVTAARVFAGYAGWGPGQLEAEVDDDDWVVGPALPDDVFPDEPEELWERVLRRMGGRYALLARMPPDPSLN